jgi:hypothetical protein
MTKKYGLGKALPSTAYPLGITTRKIQKNNYGYMTGYVLQFS